MHSESYRSALLTDIREVARAHQIKKWFEEYSASLCIVDDMVCATAARYPCEARTTFTRIPASEAPLYRKHLLETQVAYDTLHEAVAAADDLYWAYCKERRPLAILSALLGGVNPNSVLARENLPLVDDEELAALNAAAGRSYEESI